MNRTASLLMRTAHRLEMKVNTRALARAVVPVARALYAAIFLISAPAHFTLATILYAARQGVPLPGLLVPLSGVMALVGGFSVLTGYKAKAGAWVLVAFLVPVTFTMHAFWSAGDPFEAALQQTMFMKNLGLLGGALLITHFGSGPLSVDQR